MRYAVNAGDLFRFIPSDGTLNPYMLLLQPLLTKESVNVDKTKVDGEAILLVEDDERIGAVVYMLRNGLGQIKPIRKGDLRIYRSVTGKGRGKAYERGRLRRGLRVAAVHIAGRHHPGGDLRVRPMRHADIFTGIGGWPLGLSWAFGAAR